MTLVEMMDEEAKKVGLTPAFGKISENSTVCIYRDLIVHDKHVAVSISGLDEMQSSGLHKLRDLVQARVKNARLSLDALKEPA